MIAPQKRMVVIKLPGDKYWMELPEDVGARVEHLVLKLVRHGLAALEVRDVGSHRREDWEDFQ